MAREVAELKDLLEEAESEVTSSKTGREGKVRLKADGLLVMGDIEEE